MSSRLADPEFKLARLPAREIGLEVRLATTTLHFEALAAARAAASWGRLSSASAPLPLSLQLIRIVMGWSVTLNGVDVPFWASWIAVTAAGALSFVGFRAAMRS